MAKKSVTKVKKPHIHTWSVTVKKSDIWHCNCESESDSGIYSVIAKCSCKKTLESYEIENILNSIEKNKPKE